MPSLFSRNTKSSASSISSASSNASSLADQIKHKRRQQQATQKDYEAALADLSSRFGGVGGVAVPPFSSLTTAAPVAVSPPSYDDFTDCVPPPAYAKKRVIVRGQHSQDYMLLHAQLASGVHVSTATGSSIGR